MEAGRRQPGMLEGLSRFLVQHERCGAGFDVAHPAGLGSGRVSITCRGCGARHEYATATIEYEREITIRPGEGAAAERPRIPPRPAPYPDSDRDPEAELEAELEPRAAEAEPEGPPERPVAEPAAQARAAGAEARQAARPRKALPKPAGDEAAAGFWSSPRTTLALLAIAAVATLIAVIAILDDGGGGGEQRAATQPTTTAPPAEPGPASGPTPAEPTVTVRTPLFSLAVPEGWNRRSAGGSLLLEPADGGRVNVQVYFQNSPTLNERAMARETARFLRREVPGAGIFPRRTEIAGGPADELTARGPGETAIAVNVLRGPYRYLLVRRIFAGAKPHVSLAAGRIVRSFELN